VSRTISSSLSNILQDLELERPLLLTNDMLTELLDKHNVLSPTKAIAYRLREKGWILPTDRKGVWEFIPADVAGIYSSNDPLLSLRTFIAKFPDTKCGLTFQTAAWLYGDSDRIPSTLDISIENSKYIRLLNDYTSVSVYKPNLPYQYVSNVPILSRESIIAHMVTKPSSLSSWVGVPEWLPNLCIDISIENVLSELMNKPQSVLLRYVYLLQGARPDISNELSKRMTIKNTIWFGDRKPVLRYDKQLKVADSLLPFDPKLIEVVV